MRKLLIGAAAIALAASGAVAQPGQGNGGGNGGANKGGGPAAASMKDQGGKPDRGPQAQQQRAAKPDRGPPAKAANVDRGPAARADNGPQRGNGPQRANDDRPGQSNARSADNRNDRAERRVVRDVVDRGSPARNVRTISYARTNYGIIDGCPPGLAKKNNGCTPPGLAKQRSGWGDEYYRPSWYGYRSIGDGRYYYDDGYLYRVNDGGSILGYLPLLGGALSVGNPWPSYYEPVSVPDYYVDYYNLGPTGGYRYADDVLYRVDPQTSAITSIAALLTGDQFSVGQQIPSGYDIYNVPYPYQDRYYDSPDANYRYSDGYVYEVDPTTQLITAAIELLT